MQDAFLGNWARESQLSACHAGSLRDLNHRFLDLAGGCSLPDRHSTQFVASLAEQLAPLTMQQRAAAADCPYALFDLRFNDVLHWRERLLRLDAHRVADAPGVGAPGVDAPDVGAPGVALSGFTTEIASFVQLALFYAWHVAANAGLTAQLLLGMRAETAAAFGRITVNDLPGLVATEAMYLSPRWSDCAMYWRTLTRAAQSSNRTALRRVQLYGLQLAAAGRLPPS